MDIETFKASIEALSICIQAQIPVLLEGPVGDAKTSIVSDLASQLCDAHHVSIVTVHEPPEYGGYQLPKDEVVDAEGRIVHPAVVREIPLDWVHRLAGVARPLLFLDEFNNGSAKVRAATMRGVLDGYWGETKIENLAVVVAQNPVELTESGSELSAALSNRFCQLPWDMPVEYWQEQFIRGFPKIEARKLPADWMSHYPAAKAMVAVFAKKLPLNIKVMPTSAALRAKPFATFRAWTVVTRALAASFSLGLTIQSPAVVLLLAGIVGSGPSTEFRAFAKNIDMPEPEDILAKPKSFTVPARDDQVYALLTAVVSAVLANNTQARWKAALEAHGTCARAGKLDTAAISAKPLLLQEPKEWDGNYPEAINDFEPLLELTRNAKKRR